MQDFCVSKQRLFTACQLALVVDIDIEEIKSFSQIFVPFSRTYLHMKFQVENIRIINILSDKYRTEHINDMRTVTYADILVLIRQEEMKSSS